MTDVARRNEDEYFLRESAELIDAAAASSTPNALSASAPSTGCGARAAAGTSRSVATTV
jgi:hypothetical protein